MALTFSKEVWMGAESPEFRLPDVVSGKVYSYSDLGSGLVTVVMFICNHCPYVKHIQKKMVELADKYIREGISFIAISSNDAESFPEDSPEKMKLIAEEFNYPFPYLYDETQEVAKAYLASCTPDWYVFDSDGKCIYHGRFDGSNHKNGIAPGGEDLMYVLDLALEEKVLLKELQKPSSGCNIKWKNGVSPF